LLVSIVVYLLNMIMYHPNVLLILITISIHDITSNVKCIYISISYLIYL